MNNKNSQGFIAWCVLIITNTTIMCLGVYTTSLAREYHERSVYRYDVFFVEQKLVSCADVVLRAIAGRVYMSTSTLLMDNCRILSFTPTMTENGIVKIEAFSPLYSSTTVIRYQFDQVNGQVLHTF